MMEPLQDSENAESLADLAVQRRTEMRMELYFNRLLKEIADLKGRQDRLAQQLYSLEQNLTKALLARPAEQEQKSTAYPVPQPASQEMPKKKEEQSGQQPQEEESAEDKARVQLDKIFYFGNR